MIKSLARCVALRARLAVTRTQRMRAVEQLASVGRAPIAGIFYHRVADTHPNDWTISCAQFERHVEYCLANFDLISLEEIQNRCATLTSFRPAVAFTFDDGYSENCDFALPLLMRHRIPCAYFVTLDHVLTGRPFAHDVKRGQPLAVNTIDEIRALASNGIEIGLHTRSHIDLCDVTCRNTLRREITDAKTELADLIGYPIRYFAFPYGLPRQLTQQAIEAVHDAGMVGFCSAYGAYNMAGQDSFHIRRVHGDPDFARLENWLTFDQRKLRRQPEVSYSLGERSLGEAAPEPSSIFPAIGCPVPHTFEIGTPET